MLGGDVPDSADEQFAVWFHAHEGDAVVVTVTVGGGGGAGSVCTPVELVEVVDGVVDVSLQLLRRK